MAAVEKNEQIPTQSPTPCESLINPTPPQPQKIADKSEQREGLLPGLNLSGEDSERALLIVIILLLMREEADERLIIALLYILL